MLKNFKLLSDTDLLLLAEKVVLRYVAAGTIPQKDMEDVKMAIVEKFLIKHDTILKAYSGMAKITTYCIAVLNRMCCEVIRKELKHWKNRNEEHQENIASGNFDIATQVAIADEVNFLNKVLLLFGNEFNKLKLFLAFFYQITIEVSDIESYSDNKKVQEYFKATDLKSKAEIFEYLAKIVNIAENKDLKPDAVRMWLNKNVDTIIVRMNGSNHRANYNKETLQILFEYFYLNVFNNEGNLKKGA